MKVRERLGIHLRFAMGSGEQLRKDIGSLVETHDHCMEVMGSIVGIQHGLREVIGSIVESTKSLPKFEPLR